MNLKLATCMSLDFLGVYNSFVLSGSMTGLIGIRYDE